jgi:hypothetical protein
MIKLLLLLTVGLPLLPHGHWCKYGLLRLNALYNAV